MTEQIVAAMSRAFDAARARDVSSATDLIQRTLAQHGLVPVGTGWRAAGPAASETPTYGRGFERKHRSLADVIETLRKGRAGLRLPGGGSALPGMPTADVPVPPGAAFSSGRFENGAGARDYRLYVPSSDQAELRGLVVMLHGCQQNPEDFALGTEMNVLAESHRFAVVYPRQTAADNPMGCWRWFEPGDQQRDRGEPSIIAGITRQTVARLGVPADRVFIAGLSAGGAMAAIMAETYPDLYAAAGIHSGLPYAAADDVASAFRAMRGEDCSVVARRGNTADVGHPRMIVFHGSADGTVHPVNAERIVAAAQTRVPGAELRRSTTRRADGRTHNRSVLALRDGSHLLECWLIEGAGHAWSGGNARGSFTAPDGPDASGEMIRFFFSNCT